MEEETRTSGILWRTKAIIAMVPLLTFADFSQEFEIHTDASKLAAARSVYIKKWKTSIHITIVCKGSSHEGEEATHACLNLQWRFSQGIFEFSLQMS
jgi:hypothetical protein